MNGLANAEFGDNDPKTVNAEPLSLEEIQRVVDAGNVIRRCAKMRVLWLMPHGMSFGKADFGLCQMAKSSNLSRSRWPDSGARSSACATNLLALKIKRLFALILPMITAKREPTRHALQSLVVPSWDWGA